ncbi:hypothetical protein [Halovivax limisalsi]|uniref:hypothetical protein n=1 Tax=Halovivax limisalsi TaxID=1453760 RepID=UPI001FFCEAA2|nr:hypothetical protein [Halovivax limisalsi]
MQPKSSLLAPRALARLGREADAAASRIARSIKAPLQFLSFWGAIGLPFAHLGLLVQGLESLASVTLFVGLLALNVVALYVGHGYNQ